MITNKLKKPVRAIRPEFGPETRFEVDLLLAPLARGVEKQLDQLKNNLLNAVPEHRRIRLGEERLRQTANEAAALAWKEGYPLLLLPVLFEETVQHLQDVIERQQIVQLRSQPILELAV